MYLRLLNLYFSSSFTTHTYIYQAIQWLVLDSNLSIFALCVVK